MINPLTPGGFPLTSKIVWRLAGLGRFGCQWVKTHLASCPKLSPLSFLPYPFLFPHYFLPTVSPFTSHCLRLPFLWHLPSISSFLCPCLQPLPSFLFFFCNTPTSPLFIHLRHPLYPLCHGHYPTISFPFLEEAIETVDPNSFRRTYGTSYLLSNPRPHRQQNCIMLQLPKYCRKAAAKFLYYYY